MMDQRTRGVHPRSVRSFVSGMLVATVGCAALGLLAVALFESSERIDATPREASTRDDTAAAVLEDGRELASVVQSQDAIHAPYGGVVPELAARNHIAHVVPVIERALERASRSLSDVEAVAATCGPGLVGSLLVGLCTAKAIARSRSLPFVGVNHIEGHLLSIELGAVDHAIDERRTDG